MKSLPHIFTLTRRHINTKLAEGWEWGEKYEKKGTQQAFPTIQVLAKSDSAGQTELLKTEERKFERKVREALEIQIQQTSPHSDQGLNQDDGQNVTTNFWKPMLAHIRSL